MSNNWLIGESTKAHPPVLPREIISSSFTEKTKSSLNAPQFNFLLYSMLLQSFPHRYCSQKLLLESLIQGLQRWLISLEPLPFLPGFDSWYPHGRQLTIVCNSKFRSSDTLFWLLQAPGTCVVYIHTYR